MKIKLLIATEDRDYVEHFSDVLLNQYADTLDIHICLSRERLPDLLKENKFDIALFETRFLSADNKKRIRLPIVLWDEWDEIAEEDKGLPWIRKYQRISAIAGAILEKYAAVDLDAGNISGTKAHITAVWSPSGGVGKTTVALAYAAHKVLEEKRVLYLNLENFSSVPVYFPENGKSISTLFEKLGLNVQVLLKSIYQKDSGSGIHYFCSPNNYDDINILSEEDLDILLNACAADVDELVIDLSSQCDGKVQTVFEFADDIFLVCDTSSASQAKRKQFMNQHNIAQRIHTKLTLVYNKGAKGAEMTDQAVQLPYIQSADPISVYKTLSGNQFMGR